MLLKQIPRDKIFRSCFIPAPGYPLVVADYSQIERRVAAELSGDRRLIEAYQNDQYLHQLTAALIADKPLDQVEKAEVSCCAFTLHLFHEGREPLSRESGVAENMSKRDRFKIISLFPIPYSLLPADVH